MWRYTFCPNFSVLSFTFLICVAQLLIFIGEMWHTLKNTDSLNEKFFLGIQLQTLQVFGMRMPWLIKEGYQLQRLFLPTFLHFGFSHLVINLLAQMIIGFMVESTMGTLRYSFFWLLVAFTSNLFGATVTSDYAIGSDPLILGTFAALFGCFVVYWNRIGQSFGMKMCMVIILVLLLVITALLLTQAAAQYKEYANTYHLAVPDTFGYLGGFLFGFLASLAFLPPGDPRQANRETRKHEQVVRAVGGVLAAIMIIILLVVFFAAVKPTKYWYLEGVKLL